MSEAYVSIIIPCYNAAKTIEKAIESVQKQSHPHWELLVVNDGSTDESQGILERVAREDSRIRLVKFVGRQGVSKARNVGLSHAAYRYAAFLDADDLWRREKLAESLTLLREKEAAIVFHSYQLMDAKGELLPQIIRVPESITYPAILKRNLIAVSTAMVDREKTGTINFPDKRHEDFCLWIKLLKEGHAARGIDEALTLIRISPDSLSGNKLRSALWTWQVYRQEVKLGLARSAYYFLHYCYYGIRKYLLKI